jgi:hypothetical protein
MLRQARPRAQAPVTTPLAGGGASIPAITGTSARPVTILLFAFAATMLLLASIPPTAGFAMGPRAGHVIERGRPVLLTLGIAFALGAIAAFGLGTFR